MLTKFLDKALGVVEKFLIFLLGISIVIIGIQIVFRYFFSSPLSWSDQASRGLFIWMTMMSVPCIFRRKGMIRFDLIVGIVSTKIRIIADVLVQGVVLFFAVFYLINSTQLCINTGGRVMAGVEIPQNVTYIAAVISMFLLVLVLVEQTIALFKEWKEVKK